MMVFSNLTKETKTMTKILLAACAALALGAVDANAQSADYHKASPLEQAKAACEIYRRHVQRHANNALGAAQHARAYDFMHDAAWICSQLVRPKRGPLRRACVGP